MRAQAAVEFVMTYGWALLLIIMMATAFAYFGIVDPSNMSPDRCIITTGFVCGEYQLNHQDLGVAEVIVEIHNILPEAIVIPPNGFTFECENCIDGSEIGNAMHCPRKYQNPADYFATPNQHYEKGDAETTIGSDTAVLFACRPGGPMTLEYDIHDSKARVRFSFDYKKAGKAFTHHAEGEIYSIIQG